MTVVQKITYFFLNNLARLALRVYYSKIRMEGLERIPKGVPTIVCPNHPNTMVDPVLMATIMPGWIHFLANYGLFQHPVTRFLMSRVFFSIPVKRPKDVPPGQKVNNLATIKICNQVLGNGGTIFMGPEATSYHYRRIRPMKDGIARIALSAAKRKRFQSSLAIMPIGTNYSQSDAFRSEVLLRVGEPIWVDGFGDEYRKDKSAAIASVMYSIRSQLENLTLHTQDEVEAQYLTWLGILYNAGQRFPVFGERLDWEKEILLRIRAWRESAPVSFAESWHCLCEYFMALSEKKTTDAALLAPPARQRWHWAFLPFYGLAVLLNAYWWIPEWVLNKVKPYKSYVAMVRLLSGVVCIPAGMFLLGMALYRWMGWIGLLGYALPAFALGLCIRPYQGWMKQQGESRAAHQDPEWREGMLEERAKVLAGTKALW